MKISLSLKAESQSLLNDADMGEGSSKREDRGESKRRKTALLKVMAMLRQKDRYGFFLAPVDLKVVPDYDTIIKVPMDLGTMTLRISEDKYSSLQDLQNDLALLARNAKTYNLPNTVYYKEADKLLDYGTKAIQKEANLLSQANLKASQVPSRVASASYPQEQGYSVPSMRPNYQGYPQQRPAYPSFPANYQQQQQQQQQQILQQQQRPSMRPMMPQRPPAGQYPQQYPQGYPQGYPPGYAPPQYNQQPVPMDPRVAYREEERRRAMQKKSFQCDDLEFQMFQRHNTDGTRFIPNESNRVRRPPPHVSPFIQFSQNHAREVVEEIDLLDIDAHNYWNIGDDNLKANYLGSQESVFLTFGDSRGQTYVESLKKFSKGIEGVVKLDERLNRLTRGAYGISEATKLVHKGADEVDKKEREKIPVLDTECGAVDIEETVQNCKNEIDFLIETAEAGMYRMNGAQSSMILQPSFADSFDAQPPALIHFEQNKNDLKKLFENRDDPNRTTSLDTIRRKLLALANYSQDPELELFKVQRTPMIPSMPYTAGMYQ